ncbi:MAG: hypothetical protein HUJ26_22450 [Planctomycetaceae bacterium]|nr:hypothetical protein [Planctomycetaceae bacterium]
MMQDRIFLPFVLGLVFGITAMLFWTGNGNSSPQRVTQPRESTVPISTSSEPEEFQFTVGSHANKPQKVQAFVVAAEPSLPPEKISEEMFERVWLPIEDLPAQALLFREIFSDKYLSPDAQVGDVITDSMLVDRSGIHYRKGVRKDYHPHEISPTMKRAYSLSIDDTSDYLKLLRPSDIVDIFIVWHSRDQQENDKLKIKRLLKGIKILDIRPPHSVSESQTPPRNQRLLTLLVTPKQAAVLMMAQSKGIVTVALTPNDHEKLEINRNTNQTERTSNKD